MCDYWVIPNSLHIWLLGVKAEIQLSEFLIQQTRGKIYEFNVSRVEQNVELENNTGTEIYPRTDPCGQLYIYRHLQLIFMIDVGKYTVRPMDP